MEHIILQDLSLYEGRRTDQLHCNQREDQLTLLTGRGRSIPQHLTRWRSVEDIDFPMPEASI